MDTAEKENPERVGWLAQGFVKYKFFANLVYKRLRPTLERHQSKDLVGFRPCTSVEDAFVVLESVCSKSLEWNFPVWFASLH